MSIAQRYTKVVFARLLCDAGSCGGSWLSTAADMERSRPASSLTSSSSSCVVGMPPSAPRGRVAWSRSSSRLSSVLPRPFRRRPRGVDARSATLPPAQQPLLAVAARPCSPYGVRHWYDPGYSRTLPWNGRAARRRGAARTAEAAAGRRPAPDAGNAGWSYGQCNGGGPRRCAAAKPDDRHSMERLDTSVSCTDDETDRDRITGRFSWSLTTRPTVTASLAGSAGHWLVSRTGKTATNLLLASRW